MVGVVGMLTLLNGTMGQSILRFLSHTMGGGDIEKLKTIFSTALTIHIFLAFFIVLILALGGNFIIENFLNIPSERINTAFIVYLVVLFGTFFNIATTPFDGIIVAHENFKILAATELMISFSRLGSALFLLFTSLDKLMVYSILTSLSAMAIALYKQSYCVRKYKECSYLPKRFNRVCFKEMTSFAGWSLFGALSSVAQGQGLAVAMNIYFGVAANAAYGIANQVNGQISNISSITRSVIYPQLLKSEGGGDRGRMLRLSILVSKIPFLLLALLGVPLIIEMGYILDLWLKEVPDFTVGITRLLIIFTLISYLSYGITAAVQSIGRIRDFQIVNGTLLILGLPVSVLFFELGFNVFSAIIVTIFFEITAHIFRLFFLKKVAKVSVKNLIKKMDLPLLTIFVLALSISFGVSQTIENGIIRLILVIVVSSAIIMTGSYWFMVEEGEKALINSWGSTLKLKLSKKFKCF